MSEVVLRAAGPGDAAGIAAIYEPYVTGTAISFEDVPPDGDQVASRMTAGAVRLPWWVAVDGGTVVGYAYASQHRARAAYRWSVDVSVYLVSSHRGCGFGTRLYRKLIPEVRALGYVSAHAGITLPNPASVRLHERLGFSAVGVFRNVGYKQGRWHDVGWWRLSLAEPPVAPDEPRTWSPSPVTDNRPADTWSRRTRTSPLGGAPVGRQTQ